MNVPSGKPPAPEHSPPGPVNMTDLQRVERAARRLRSAEAQVDDLRLALNQEIHRASEMTNGPLRPPGCR
jgi:hypothetical protein